jgi:hypothetical protein
VTTTAGADLTVVQEEFHVNRLIYRYFPPGPTDCAIVEKCIGAPGCAQAVNCSPL